jgi:hypothetical protein
MKQNRRSSFASDRLGSGNWSKPMPDVVLSLIMTRLPSLGRNNYQNHLIILPQASLPYPLCNRPVFSPRGRSLRLTPTEELLSVNGKASSTMPFGYIARLSVWILMSIKPFTVLNNCSSLLPLHCPDMVPDIRSLIRLILPL